MNDDRVVTRDDLGEFRLWTIDELKILSHVELILESLLVDSCAKILE